MAKKTISLNIQQSAERYLASLNSSRERLTDEQWETVTTHVKLQRNRKIARVVFLLVVIIFASLTIWGFCIINKRIQLYVPNGIISVTEEGSESAITLKPEEIECVISGYVRIGSIITRCFDCTVLFLFFFVITWIEERQRNKIFRVFMPKL